MASDLLKQLEALYSNYSEYRIKSGKSEIMDGAQLFPLVINKMASDIYQHNVAAGWYTNLHTGLPYTAAATPDGRNIPEMLMLIVSEIGEAMEGYRKSLPDDKLPHRSMIEVELADAMIRIFDLAGYMQLDLGGAIAEKRAYNAQRQDHKLETRQSGGKKF